MVISDWNAIYMIPSWTRPHEAALAGRIPNKLTAPALRQPMPTLATMKSAANISSTKKIRATISQMNQESIFTFRVPVLMVMTRFYAPQHAIIKGRELCNHGKPKPNSRAAFPVVISAVSVTEQPRAAATASAT